MRRQAVGNSFKMASIKSIILRCTSDIYRVPKLIKLKSKLYSACTAPQVRNKLPVVNVKVCSNFYHWPWFIGKRFIVPFIIFSGDILTIQFQKMLMFWPSGQTFTSCRRMGVNKFTFQFWEPSCGVSVVPSCFVFSRSYFSQPPARHGRSRFYF